jgi:4'-phosphopantetheinyl transferase
MKNDRKTYPPPGGQYWQLSLPANTEAFGDVHVWRAALDLSAHQTAQLLSVLSSEEQDRAARFHFEQDRNRFIVARSVLRGILSRYLNIAPREMSFGFTEFGKPYINDIRHDHLAFNVSHAGGWGLFAVSRGRETGIDLEPHRHDVDIQAIGQRFFSTCEFEALSDTFGDRRAALFFQYWTRKEAVMKAIGKGLSIPSGSFDVTQVSGEVPVQVPVSADMADDDGWFALDLFAGGGWSAAVAARGGGWSVSCFEYDMSDLSG